MLLQGNDTPTATRIRENQRRSRNRRKELIDDLQKRVQEYEQQGVRATQEVQKAARRVSEENTGLRDLLFRHGVSQGEIEEHLRSFRTPGSTCFPTNHAIAPTSQPQIVCETRSDTSDQYPMRPRSHIHVRDITVRKGSVLATSSVDQPSKRLDAVPSPAASQVHRLPSPRRTCAKPSVPEEPDCPNTADCFCPPSIAATYQSFGGFEISCEAAATIIVEMRGDGDIDSARASLGCRGPEECSVKNSTVMQIMDEG